MQFKCVNSINHPARRRAARPGASGCIDSVECGTVEWNSGTVEWWNSGMVGCSIDDPVPSTAVFMALTSVRNYIILLNSGLFSCMTSGIQ